MTQSKSSDNKANVPSSTSEIFADELLEPKEVEELEELVGRVKWIEDSKSVGKDNCCWYLFDYNHTGPTEFYGRLL